MIKSLMLGAKGELARIDTDKEEYLIASDDYCGMIEVDREKFLEFVASLAKVFLTSWSVEAQQNYKEFLMVIPNKSK